MKSNSDSQLVQQQHEVNQKKDYIREYNKEAAKPDRNKN